MPKPSVVLSLLSLVALTSLATATAGCAADSAASVDDQAPAVESSESELRKTTFTRLDTATAAEVADTFVATFNAHLDTVLAAHPSTAAGEGPNGAPSFRPIAALGLLDGLFGVTVAAFGASG